MSKSEKRMDFDRLIDSSLIYIFERIIKHAADREIEWKMFYTHDHHDDETGQTIKQAMPKKLNSWLWCMRKYSQVSKKWRNAILNPIDDLTSLVDDFVDHDFVDCTIAPNFPEGCMLIHNGFLAVTKNLHLRHVSSAAVDMIVKNLGENVIEMVEIDRPKEWNAVVAYTRFTDIIMRCDKATTFFFWFGDVKSHEEASAILQLINAAVHCNAETKKIAIEFSHRYWNREWHFTDDIRGGPGSIGELNLHIPPKERWEYGRGPDWSRFGEIESIRMYANMVDDFRDMAVRTVTESITLLFLAQSRSDLDDLHELVDGLSPQEIDVEISCACDPTLEDDDDGEPDSLVFTKTFACDASLVENVRKWRCDIEAKIPWPFFEDENQKPKRRKISTPRPSPLAVRRSTRATKEPDRYDPNVYGKK